jgi:prevent-host-death family protein
LTWTIDWSISLIVMRTSVSQAKGQLTELVKLAEAGEDVVLTRFGRDVVRLVPLSATPSATERRAALERARIYGRTHAKPGPSAARSQDFLYDDETGLPK